MTVFTEKTSQADLLAEIARLKAASAGKAGPALEALCNAIEETCNNMFYNGNWPQGYGASSAVCNPPACTRAHLEQAGEMWRQAIVFNLVFTLDTN